MVFHTGLYSDSQSLLFRHCRTGTRNELYDTISYINVRPKVGE